MACPGHDDLAEKQVQRTDLPRLGAGEISRFTRSVFGKRAAVLFSSFTNNRPIVLPGSVNFRFQKTIHHVETAVTGVGPHRRGPLCSTSLLCSATWTVGPAQLAIMVHKYMVFTVKAGQNRKEGWVDW